MYDGYMDKTMKRIELSMQAKSYYAMLFGLTASAISHFAFLLLFYHYGVTPLVYYNIFSVAFFAALTLAIFKTQRALYVAMIATGVEFIVHQSAAVVYVGLDFGFQYYLMIIPPFIFVGQFKNKFTPYLFTALSVMSLIALYLYGFTHPPLYDAMNGIAKIVNLANIANTAVAMGIISGLYVYYTDRYEDRLIQAQQDLYVAATVDTLTGLGNRKHTAEKIEELYDRAQRTGREYVLAIVDIDDFKGINDRFGHDIGDAVLVTVANIMKTTLRRTDVVGRWGGEEFLIALPETGFEMGLEVLEQLRLNILHHRLHFSGSDVSVTVTVGAVVSAGRDNRMLFKLADDAMYEGKKAAKNCVVGRR